MVDILPFNGFVYNKDKIGNISGVISPPYDVISASLREKLINFHPNNIANLILPKGSGDDKYTGAKKLLDEWTKKQILKFDNDRCFYIIQESFYLNNKLKKITGFIGLTRLEPYSSLQVIPHEQTYSKIKEDRLKLLSFCRTNFGPVYTLYNDSKNKIPGILKETQRENPIMDISAGYDSTLGFKVWKIADEEKIDKIIRIMKDQKLIIADGHHRYETSLVYKEKYDRMDKKRDQNPRATFPEDFILTLYVESSQNDLTIFPTYRNIKFKRYPGIEKIIASLAGIFDIEKDTLKSTPYLTKKLLESKSRDLKSFFIYGENKKLYFITLKKSFTSGINRAGSTSGSYLKTDVNILQEYLMDKISSSFQIEKINYNHSIDGTIENIDTKNFDVGILLNAITIEELKKICMAGHILPEKSTYFYPKPSSGLIMYRFDK